MEKMIGYCGYSCHLCAARSKDPKVRQKLVDGWRRIFGHEHYTAENVYCEGCRSDGKIADKECKVRPCAKEKNIESCVFCEEFPCEKVSHLLASDVGMFIFCKPTSKLTKEEYELCMKQFNSMGTIVELLIEAGKLPSWIKTQKREKGDG
jgi:hypothetical protein